MASPHDTYDISTHALLSAAAKSLHTDDVDAFNAEVDGAAYVLKLDGKSYEGDKLERAKLALVYQVNFQLSRPKDADFYKSRKSGERTNQYRDALPSINSQAKLIADELLIDDDETVTRESRTMAIDKKVQW